MSLDEDYPKDHSNLVPRLSALLSADTGLDATGREDVALALNEIADHAGDVLDIMNRLVNEGHTPAEVGELLIAFELTVEQIRGYSDVIDGKLYEIGDRLKGVTTSSPE